MERVAAIGEPCAPRRCTNEFDGGLNAFGSGIGEKRLFKVRHTRKKALGQHACERRHIHLHKVWKFAVENLAQRGMHLGIIASDREDPPSAQEVKISGALAIP